MERIMFAGCLFIYAMYSRSHKSHEPHYLGHMGSGSRNIKIRSSLERVISQIACLDRQRVQFES